MTRPIKHYSDEIKAHIYRKLSGRTLTFSKLITCTRKNRVTLSQYLKNGKDELEIEWDQKTKKYSLTAKGRDELNRITTTQEIRKQAVWYSDELELSREIIEPDPDEKESLKSLLWNGFLEDLETPPLPVPVSVTTYGSDQDLFYSATRSAHRAHPSLGPRRIRKEILRKQTGSVARNVVWDVILDRVWRLLELHRAYSGKRTLTEPQCKESPLPLTLESILGFDMSLTIRYEGTKLMKSKQTAKLLAGSLLLQIAMTEGVRPEAAMAPGFPTFYDIFPYLEKGGLIEGIDVDRITKGGILEVAFRYLAETGVLKLHSTPHHLAETIRPTVTGDWQLVSARRLTKERGPR